MPQTKPMQAHIAPSLPVTIQYMYKDRNTTQDRCKKEHMDTDEVITMNVNAESDSGDSSKIDSGTKNTAVESWNDTKIFDKFRTSF